MPKEISKVSERTKRMQENFIKEREEGKSFAEIAKKYGINVATVYSNLQDIADTNNTSREELLYRPSGPHMIMKKREYLKDKIDPNKLKENFGEIRKNTQEIIKDINDAIDEIQREETDNE